MTDYTDRLLAEIADRSKKQQDIAETYAAAIGAKQRAPDGAPVTDWSRVNRAILDRWTLTGLERIKKQAWERLEHGVRA